MTLTQRQRQLVLTAMDAGASEGERANAAAFLFRSLRQQFPDGHALIAALETNLAQADRSKYGSTVLPFGKHKGQRLDQVDPTYLLWLLDSCETLGRQLRRAIARYLQDTQYAD